MPGTPPPPSTPAGRSSLPAHASTSRLPRMSLPPQQAGRISTGGFKVGARVFCAKKGAYGIVKFLGQTSFAPEGVWVGLELDHPWGKHDGSLNGVRYFDARPHHGVFVRPSACSPLLPDEQPPASTRRRPAFTTFTRTTHKCSPTSHTATISTGTSGALHHHNHNHASPPAATGGAAGSRAALGGARAGAAMLANDEMLIELIIERVTQSGALQDKLKEQVEEELQQRVKAVEERMSGKLDKIAETMANHLTALQGRIEAAILEAQQAADAAVEAEEGAAAASSSQAAHDQAQALEAILQLANQAKMAILEDVRARCEEMVLAD